LPANCTELELQTVAEAVVGRQPSSSYLVTDISDPIPPDIELLLGCFAVCCLLFCRRKQVHSSLNQLLRSRQASFIHDAVSCLSILCVCFFFRPANLSIDVKRTLLRRCNCCAIRFKLHFLPARGDFCVVLPLCVWILALVIPLQQNNFGALCVRPNLWVGPKFGNFSCHTQGKDKHKHLRLHGKKLYIYWKYWVLGVLNFIR